MSTSEALFKEAQKYIVGGVNSPVRAFNNVDCLPIFFQEAKGAFLYDINNKPYLDYIGGWGPMIMGHNHEDIIQQATLQLQKGICFGAPSQLETLLAQQICKMMPNMQRIRMMNSGTEATMTAIRLARGYTGKNKIVKFSGCYHGHVDALLAEAGSGLMTLNIPGSTGIPPEIIQQTIIIPYNDENAVNQIFSDFADEIACVIVEPVAGNMGCILPKPNFLPTLQKNCSQAKTLLIFDEVITGFRVTLGGAQEYYNIQPDLTTLGKIIGGGMPVGALGGRQEIMDLLAPNGPVYQAGTLSGNPLTMATGLASLKLLEKTQDLYQKLSQNCQILTNGLQEIAKNYHVPLTAQYIGGLFGIFFNEKLPYQLAQVKNSNTKNFRYFFQQMLRQGIYFAPSPFESGFMSYAHTKEHIDQTLKCAEQIFSQMI